MLSAGARCISRFLADSAGSACQRMRPQRCRLTEAWAARDSLVVTDPLGMTDLPLPQNVRLYFFCEHAASGKMAPIRRPTRGSLPVAAQPDSYREAQRALLGAMQAWVTKGTLPPPSQYPEAARRHARPRADAPSRATF